MPVNNQTYASNRNPFNYAKIEQVDRDFVTAWLTLPEIRQQLNLFDDESQDTYLSSLEIATRFAIEDYLGMSVFATQYRIYYGNPGLASTALYLDLPEVSIGSSGVTIDSIGVWSGLPPELTELDSETYWYDSTGNRIILQSIPNDVNQYNANPIEVLYTVEPNIIMEYPVIKQAGLLLLTHLYNQRSNSTSVNLRDIPFGVSTLLRLYKPLIM
tara:strand:- start:23615 stop:24256 length:642 start_codon:yes stop_codon:yes gene_type:complete